jgi:hypothetical protein
MATMVLFAMFQAQETAKAHRTRALITKLNMIIMRRYDEYRTRRVPYIFPAVSQSAAPADQVNAQRALAKARLDCLRDLMRLEMPDRWSDVTDNPIAPFPHGINSSILPTFNGQIARPAVSTRYLAKYNAAYNMNNTWPTSENQGAECLYMIVMESLAQEGDAREFFKPTDIADVDEDQCPEFVDAWNQPIEFIRWAPGYLSEMQSPLRLAGSVSQVDAHTATVSVTANYGPRLNQTPGSYVGGTIAFLQTGNKEQLNIKQMGRISGYRYDATTTPPTVIFTCSTPSGVSQQAFNGESPSNAEFVVLQPDPFDSRGIYPIYNSLPHLATPTYAIYPLIVSKGKDRAMGIKDGKGGGGTLQYTQEGLNPFYFAPPVNEAYELMLGSIPSATDGEPNWYQGCDKDNITNHQLTTR